MVLSDDCFTWTYKIPDLSTRLHRGIAQLLCDLFAIYACIDNVELAQLLNVVVGVFPNCLRVSVAGGPWRAKFVRNAHIRLLHPLACRCI